MSRAIDADELIHRIGLIPLEYEHRPAVKLFYSMIEKMPALTPPNEPLTFEERREMGRKPVWLDDEKTFGILQFWDDNNVDAVFLDPSGCIRVKSVIGKKIYRRPPEGEEDT